MPEGGGSGPAEKILSVRNGSSYDPEGAGMGETSLILTIDRSGILEYHIPMPPPDTLLSLIHQGGYNRSKTNEKASRLNDPGLTGRV